jgi:hypothetical protein
MRNTIREDDSIADCGFRIAEWVMRNANYGMKEGEAGNEPKIYNPKSAIRNPK